MIATGRFDMEIELMEARDEEPASMVQRKAEQS
ncbi:uncharacterized protein METZ01_LOCUS356131 [marine metagenome]|uniref:Uncharacterized protein n=1 Tax=marine metagenome TaxID=408172 RepID=A0A382S233_9ZZZZ